MSLRDTTQATELLSFDAVSFDPRLSDYDGYIRALCPTETVRYLWPHQSGRLKDAHCPRCRRRLRQTTWYAHGTWIVLDRCP